MCLLSQANNGVGVNRQAEQVGNVLERGTAVALEIEAPRGRLEHAVAFESVGEKSAHNHKKF